VPPTRDQVTNNFLKIADGLEADALKILKSRFFQGRLNDTKDANVLAGVNRAIWILEVRLKEREGK
jgi:hypothetical protein